MPDWMRSSGTRVLLIASLVLAVLFGFQFYQNQRRLEAQKQIELLDVRVAFGQDERRVSTGVFGTVLNNSEQVIKMLEITIDYLSKEDEVIKSARFFPVSHLSFQNPGTLEPQLETLHKSYLDGEGRTLHILRGVDLRLEQPGQTAAIVGASGTGKSTLLHLIGLLDQPDQGRVLLDDKDLSLLSRDAQARYRNTQLGFIFQFHQLLQDFSALENVMMPALVKGQSHSQSRKRASELLEQVGLGERLLHRPSQLSGGEQQRVAIARALTNRPRLLLAAAPTGNLDQENESQVLDTLLRCCADGQTTMLMITHNPQLATTLQQCYRLQDGRLQLDSSS